MREDVDVLLDDEKGVRDGIHGGTEDKGTEKDGERKGRERERDRERERERGRKKTSFANSQFRGCDVLVARTTMRSTVFRW